MLTSQDRELLNDLTEFSEHVSEIYENPGEASDEISLNEKPVVAPVSDSQIEFGKAIALCCSATNWGGWFKTEWPTLRDAFRKTDLKEFNGHDPTVDNGSGKSLVDLLTAFDGRSKHGFAKTFANLTKARKKLVKFVPALISHPLVLMATNRLVRNSVGHYLASYEELIRQYRTSEAKLNSKSPQANELAIAELLRLDVIHIHSENEWKALLTPLHPFYLWRFREVLNACAPSNRRLTEDERSVLSKAMQSLPHLLHFLVSSPVEETRNFRPIPLAGSLQGLPTYENDTNRYLGADGIDFIADAIALWLGHAPYSRSQVRLAIIDPPKSEEVLEELVDFLVENDRTALVVDVFTTRSGNHVGDFGVGGVSKQTHLLEEFRTNDRLQLRVHDQLDMTGIRARLSESPVHICFSFDQGSYECHNASRAEDLIVSPLVVTYDYEYDPITERGTISPSVDTDRDGLFSDYHLMVRRISHLGPDCIPRLKTGQPPNVKVLSRSLQTSSLNGLFVLTETYPHIRLTRTGRMQSSCFKRG